MNDELLSAIESVGEQHPDTTLADSWLLGFDTETTGIAAGRDAIVSATLVLRDPAKGHAGDVIASWIVNPHRPMNPRASEVNGFTDEFLAEHGEEPTVAVEAIAALIAAAQARRIPLLAYNAPFDVHMLEGDLKRWKLDSLDERQAAAGVAPQQLLVVDPLVIDRKVSRRKGKRTLTDTTFYYGVEPHGDFHDATADTIAAVDLIAPMATLYPQVGHLALGDLMAWQHAAYADWRDSFNEWLSSRGRTPVRGDWL
ncbi:exonuclease domain-containing protein [Bifidobacterium avesanii]|uniref:DNA polymerase III subunit epsilon n=1 Tax=Bifidobacterium avesanii TaxID=1798157 RepID=A0A7K3TI47_9BIFI|nr:exonuclease domain-containing protein [Bifidobacterium avesanii]KAB8291008.1 DNA polymerase III subunit epsilon [Bifidobacterium avesanii]NEG78775.1 DNA polymerase III subunit epsilon [Bifidobacterium avesanii]